MTEEIFISIGSQCSPGFSLQELDKHTETYPFDWVRSNSKIIYDVLLNGPEKYLTFDSTGGSDDYFTKHLDTSGFREFPLTHINSYGQFFTHYPQLHIDEVITKFRRYMDRFFDVLNSTKQITFIHTHEEYLYHKLSRDNKNNFYEYLCKINDLLVNRYPSLKFKILNIDIDNNHTNYGNIINLSAGRSNHFTFSDNSETHHPMYYDKLRYMTTEVISQYINGQQFHHRI